MKIAIINDTHAGARNSSDIFIEYQRQFYEDILFPYLKENNIRSILHLGDYFEHRRFINFKTLKANYDHFIRHLESDQIDMYIIPGNHDVLYKNTNFPNSIQLLLEKSPYVIPLYEPTELQFDSLNILMIPWVNSQNLDATNDILSKSTADVVAGHFELSGFEMYRGQMSYDGQSIKHLERFPTVISGHYHTKSSKNNIHYLGAQFEFTWADYKDPKYFHILDTETGELEPIQNKNYLFYRLEYTSNLDLDKVPFYKYTNKFVKVVTSDKNDPYHFDRFIYKLKEVNPFDLKIIDSFIDNINENVNVDMENIDNTDELIKLYIDEYELEDNSINKELLKKKIFSYFSEALQFD